jgi:hypothetical protein
VNRLRVALGLLAGVLMILSSAAHSLLGWSGLRAELAKVQAPVNLVTGLSIGWHFAGLAMFAFGSLVLLTFIDAVRGRAVSFRTAGLIALVYLLFGVWALRASNLDPFFLVFIVPGLMLAAASWRAGVIPPVRGD